MSELTHKDLHWFALANAGTYTWKSSFYEFKDRFLRRFAAPAGFDLQSIRLLCHNCDGSGMWSKGESCRRCAGTGIYDIRKHWLQRFDLAGHIYHKPLTHAEVYHLHVYRFPDPVEEFTGHIKHAPVDSRVAYRCFLRLLLRWEPVTFYWHVVALVKHKACCYRTRLVWRLIRLRDKLDLFPAVDQSPDDVPF